MAWLWSSPSPPTDEPSSTAASSSAPSSSSENAPHDSSEPHLPRRPLTRDELAYEELKDMFARVDSEGTQRAASAAKSKITSTSHRAAEASNSAIYPSTMSCRQVWDLAFYCQSIGGQMNNYYRYGGLRSCSELWGQWRFCMRMKGVRNEDEKRARIQQWYKERAMRYKIGPSSEDIWKIRKIGDEEDDDGHEEDKRYNDRDGEQEGVYVA